LTNSHIKRQSTGTTSSQQEPAVGQPEPAASPEFGLLEHSAEAGERYHDNLYAWMPQMLEQRHFQFELNNKQRHISFL